MRLAFGTSFALMLLCAGAGAAPRQSAAATPTAVAAAPPPSPPTGDPRERARVLFERGVAAYGERRYYEAIDIFHETQRVFPTPHLAFNIAKAYDHVGNQAGALRYYREYLRGSPEAGDAAEVSRRVSELETLLAQRGIQQLTVISVPEGATLFVEEEAVGVTPWTGEMAPGQYRVVLRREGFMDRDSVVELASEHAREVKLALDAKPKPAPVVRKAPVEGSAWPTNRVGTLTWASLAIGSAALGGALAIEATSSGNESGFTRGGAFLAGTGAAFAVGGGVLLCLDLCGSTPGLGKRVGLRLGPAAASFEGSF